MCVCVCVCVTTQIAERAGYSADKGGPMHIVCSKVEDLTVLPGGIDKVSSHMLYCYDTKHNPSLLCSVMHTSDDSQERLCAMRVW